MRFSIKVMLLVLTVACLGFAYASHIWRTHSAICKSEMTAVEDRELDLEFATECTLPEWFAPLLPTSVSCHFDHIVEIYVPLDDLANVDPASIESYHCCEYVRELRIGNETIPKAVFDALLSFPRLKRIIVFPHQHPYNGPDAIKLSRYQTEKIEIKIDF